MLEYLEHHPKISKIYGLRFDPSFKNVYQDKYFLKMLLKDLFHDDFRSIKCIKDRELVKDNVNLKCGRCDLVVETTKNILLIEVQNQNLKDFKKRIRRYVSILYTEQVIKRSYSEMKAVKVYLILNYQDGVEQTLKQFSLLEKELKEKFDQLSELKVWSIPLALKSNPKSLNYKYARLFLLDLMDKVEALNVLKEYSSDERLKDIVEKIIIYNLDVEMYQQLKEVEVMEESWELATSGIREAARREGRRVGRKEGKIEGKKEGMKEGMKEGRREGRREGRQEAQKEIASNLLSIGVPLDLIVRATKLSEQQIQNYVRS